MTRFLHGTNQAPTSSRTPSTVHVGRKERINGWTCPWHPLQFVAWFFIIFFGIVYFGIFVLHLPSEWKAAGYIIPGGLLVVHVVFHLAALSIDPADRNIHGTYLKEKQAFDRNLHAHVIENNHCHICETDVSPTSKHCSVCNKCISDFDHHCKWLNTCVGGRNYKLFIGCVASGFILALIILAFTLYLFVIFFVSKSDLLQTQTDGKLKLFVPVADNVFVIFVGAVIALLLVTIALLGHLLGFHIYIICLNISTYEYIVNSRDKSTTADVESGCQRSKKFKNNKVRPSATTETNEISFQRNEDVTDNDQSAVSREQDEPAVKIMNEVSSKAIKRQGSPNTPRDSGQSPRVVLHSSGYADNDVGSSSDESLREFPPPDINIEPPSDGSRSPSPSPRRTRSKSSQSKKDTSQGGSQSAGPTSAGKTADQSAGDTSSRQAKANSTRAIQVKDDMSSQGNASTIGDLADDDSEEDLLPIAQSKPKKRQETEQTSKKKKSSLDGDNSTEINSKGSKKKKKKKRSKTPEPIELPPLATRGRPLPSLESYKQGEEC